MTALKHFLLFWYDFIVGEDWMLAAGVVMALLLSAALARREWLNHERDFLGRR